MFELFSVQNIFTGKDGKQHRSYKFYVFNRNNNKAIQVSAVTFGKEDNAYSNYGELSAVARIFKSVEEAVAYYTK